MIRRLVGGLLACTVALLPFVGAADAAVRDRSDPNCPGVRPGAVMLPAKGQQLVTSWNFLLRGSDGGTYSFVEGKVINPDPGNASVTIDLEPVYVERTWAQRNGPGVADGAGRAAGNAVWYARDNNDEYGLVRLSRGQRWSSRMCGVDKTPTSLDMMLDSVPATVVIYGQDSARTTRSQTDVLPYGRNRPKMVSKATPVTSGDWSAPVLSGDGQALGFLANSACCQTEDRMSPAGSGGLVYRLQPLMDRAGKRLNIELKLQRASNGVAR